LHTKQDGSFVLYFSTPTALPEKSLFCNPREKLHGGSSSMESLSANPSDASDWVLIRRLLALSWRYRWGCLRVLGLQLVMVALAIWGLGFTGLGVDEIRHAVGAGPSPHWPWGWAPPGDWTPWGRIAFVAMLVAGVAAIRAVVDGLSRHETNYLVQGQIVVQMRADVYSKLQQLSFRFYDANASSSIINRVTSDVQSVRMFVDQVLIQGLTIAISLVAFATYMFSIHVPLTFACLATTPLLWVASSRFSHTVQPGYRANRDLTDNMIQRLAENIRGIAVIKAFARESDEIRKFRESNDVLRMQKQYVFKVVSFFMPAIGFLSQVNLVVLLAYGGTLVIHGRIPLGVGLITFTGMLQQFSAQIANIAAVANSMQESLTGARRVFEVLDAPLEIVNAPDPMWLPRVWGRVTFEHIWFDPGTEPILADICFEVQPGQCVAVVGPTGAGKSALLSLIPRFYDASRGRLLIDGVDIRKLELSAARRNVGLVFQESFLFSTTVAANIAFGVPGATREQVEKAARIASAHDFIMELPKGYETILGEGGSGLSGGQRQRLAIARAVLLDPAILLLDDPTAAIDAETEHEIVEAMQSAMTGRTTFIVAHRLSTLRNADLVVVLDLGRVVQMGTHEELLRREGYYAVAARLQTWDRAA
jgi:ATP-binding cassette subfamily B protein